MFYTNIILQEKKKTLNQSIPQENYLLSFHTKYKNITK